MSELAKMMNALTELNEYLEDGEQATHIVFGAWGWGSLSGMKKAGYGEPKPPPVPFDVRGKLLPINEAKKYMDGWTFNGGFGAPDCYAVYIWTNKRVIWVTQYDGSTRLDSAPRNPIDCIPIMPGG